MMRHLKIIRKVRKKHEKNWLSLNGVVGVGIGNTSDGNVGIIVAVRDNAEIIRQKIPNEIDRIPIEIKFTGDIVAF